jgi:hypothetical protein
MIGSLLNQAAARIASTGALGATVDLVRQVAATRDPLAIAGAAFVAYNGLNGILRTPTVPSSDRFPAVSEGIRFADSPPLANDVLFRALGREHVAYNLIGLAQTFGAMGNAMEHYAHEVGFETYLRTYMDTLSNGDRLAISEELKGAQRSVLEKVGVIYSDWVMKYAGRQRLERPLPRFGKDPARSRSLCHRPAQRDLSGLVLHLRRPPHGTGRRPLQFPG